MLMRKKHLTLDEITIPPLSEYDLYRDGVTQSMLKNMNCPKRLLLWLNGFKAYDKDYKTTWGSLIHDLKDKMYTFYKNKKALPNKRLFTTWAVNYSHEFMQQSEYLQKDVDTAIIIMNNYITHFAVELKSWKISRAEREFKIFLKAQPDIPIRGKIDLEFYNKKNEFYMLETKTIGNIQEGKIALKLGINPQNTIYSIASSSEGNPYKKIVYDIIRNSTMKQGKKETYDSFLERFNNDILQRPEHYFKRFEINLAYGKELEIAENDLCDQLSVLKEILKTGRFYKNTFACEDPYICDYLTACANNTLIGYKKEPLFQELRSI